METDMELGYSATSHVSDQRQKMWLGKKYRSGKGLLLCHFVHLESHMKPQRMNHAPVVSSVYRLIYGTALDADMAHGAFK